MVEHPEALVVHVGVQTDGCTYILSPVTRAYCELGERRVPSVYLGTENPPADPLEFAHLGEDEYGRWKIVASMLTGFPEAQLPLVEFRRMPGEVLLARLG